MQIIRNVRLEVDHAIVMFSGSVRNSLPNYQLLGFEQPIFKKKRNISPPRDNSHKGELSKAAYRRLKRAVTWLEHIAEVKQMEVDTKCCMLTLTVPSFSHEIHEQLLKGVLNVFLQFLRSDHGVKNYVWKAELTKKGKLHYHLLTDSVLNESKCRKRWNKILYDRGLLEKYISDFSGRTLKEYLDHRENYEGKANQKEYKDRVGAYKYGQATGWKNPRSVQLDQIPVTDSLSSYLGKYLGKSTGSDGESKKITGRIWGCSQNLSEKNVCRFQVSPMTADVQVLKDLLEIAKDVQPIEFELNGIRKEVGYKVFFNSDLWYCDQNSGRLSQIFRSYMSHMRSGRMRHNWQKRVQERIKQKLQSEIDSKCVKVQEKEDLGVISVQLDLF